MLPETHTRFKSLLKISFVEVSRTCCDMYISKSVPVYPKGFFLKSLKSFEKLFCELCAEPSEVAVCRAVCGVRRVCVA